MALWYLTGTPFSTQTHLARFCFFNWALTPQTASWRYGKRLSLAVLGSMSPDTPCGSQFHSLGFMSKLCVQGRPKFPILPSTLNHKPYLFQVSTTKKMQRVPEAPDSPGVQHQAAARKLANRAVDDLGPKSHTNEKLTRNEALNINKSRWIPIGTMRTPISGKEPYGNEEQDISRLGNQTWKNTSPSPAYHQLANNSPRYHRSDLFGPSTWPCSRTAPGGKAKPIFFQLIDVDADNPWRFVGYIISIE